MTLSQIANLIEVRNGLPFSGIGARSRFRVMVDSRRLFALCAWRRGFPAAEIASELKISRRQVGNLVGTAVDLRQRDAAFAASVNAVESAIVARDGGEKRESVPT